MLKTVKFKSFAFNHNFKKSITVLTGMRVGGRLILQMLLGDRQFTVHTQMIPGLEIHQLAQIAKCQGAHCPTLSKPMLAAT